MGLDSVPNLLSSFPEFALGITIGGIIGVIVGGIVDVKKDEGITFNWWQGGFLGAAAGLLLSMALS